MKLRSFFVFSIFFFIFVHSYFVSITAQEAESSPSLEAEIEAGADVEADVKLDEEGAEADADSELEASADEEEFEGDVDVELGGGGIAPDSVFYFVDEFFDRFGNCIDNRKEKIAEIKAMIGQGKIEDAKKALEKYEGCAEEVEREVSPDEHERTKRSSRAIRKVIRDIEKDIPDDEREKFTDIIDKERRIETAAEIASKIKDLCVELSRLDPSEYSRVCTTKDDAPDWQKRLNADLTEEQRNGARKFADVMSQCFKTQGKECKCSELEDVNKPFADRCSLVAPLAAKCDSGDESACEAMEDATEGIEDLLPDYLQDVMFELERVTEDQFEFHMPGECRERGAKGPKECIELMFRSNAPGPCLNALDRGEISFNNEREAREACERIMFEENAPSECIEAGLRDYKECGKLMFEENAPSECIEAGLTGEYRDDPKKCERLMREKGFDRGKGRGPEPGFNFDCKKIANAEERLKCYDNALEGFGGSGESGPAGFGGREGRGHWPPPCEEAQAFTPESCEKIMIGKGKERFRETEAFQENFARECSERGGRWDCSFSSVSPERPCRCFTEDRGEVEYDQDFENSVIHEGRRPPPEGFRPEEFRPQEGFQQPEGEFRPLERGEFQQPPGEQSPSPEEHSTTITTTESSGTSGTEGTSGGESNGEISATSTTTGRAIAIDNNFLEYYFD